MRRDNIDFFLIAPDQIAMHERLCNWSRYVQVKGTHWQASIWKMGKSNGRQWHEPQMREEVNTLDGHAIEKAVGLLPAPHRDALRWNYVWKSNPSRMRRLLGVTDAGLMRLVSDGRAMLANRRV